MNHHALGYCIKFKGWGRPIILILLWTTAAMLFCGCAATAIRTGSIDCVDKAIAEMIVYKRHNPDAEIYAAVAQTNSRFGSQSHVEPVVKKGQKYYCFGFDSLLQNIEEHDMRGVFEEEPVLYPMAIFMTAAERHNPLTLIQLRIYNAVLLTAKG